jgi:hypothetical protein
MGVQVIKKLHTKHNDTIYEWLESEARIRVHYPDITSQIIDTIIQNHIPVPATAAADFIWDKPYYINPV